MTPQEERGVALFKDPTKGNCASCHLTSSRGGMSAVPITAALWLLGSGLLGLGTLRRSKLLQHAGEGVDHQTFHPVG